MGYKNTQDKPGFPHSKSSNDVKRTGRPIAVDEGAKLNQDTGSLADHGPTRGKRNAPDVDRSKRSEHRDTRRASNVQKAGGATPSVKVANNMGTPRLNQIG
jgi:hypothetical protein